MLINVITMKVFDQILFEPYLMDRIDSTSGSSTLDLEEIRRQQEASRRERPESTTEAAELKTTRDKDSGKLVTSRPGTSGVAKNQSSDQNSFQARIGDSWAALGNARETNNKLSSFPETPNQVADAFANYDKETGLGKEPNKPALHIESNGEPTYCNGQYCSPANKVKGSDGKEIYNFGNNNSIDAAIFEQGREIFERGAAGSSSNTEADKSQQESTDTVAARSAQPAAKAEIERSKSLSIKDQKGFSNINILGQGDSSLRDSNEAKNALLDGQLDSSSNTFTTFEKDGQKYMGFASGGFDGKLDGNDDRYGVIKLDKDGKIPGDVNLGAGEGWEKASPEIKAILKAGHEARTAEIEKAGGIENHRKNEAAKRTIDNLQNYAAKNTDINSSQLNELMTKLNNGENFTEELQNQLNDFTNTKFGDKTISDLASESRINELKTLGLSNEKITKLSDEVSKANSYSEKQQIIDKAVDAERDAKHKLTDEQKKEFTESLKDLQTRVTDPKQKEILDKVTKLSQGDGLDKMGKYLARELKNISSQNPKPIPRQEDSRATDESKTKPTQTQEASKRSIDETNPQETNPSQRIDPRTIGGFKPRTLDELNQKIAAYKANGANSVELQFSTSWCGHCRAPAAKNLAAHDRGKAVIYVDGDNREFAALQREHNVQGYPSFRRIAL